jgi:hypothetical protein
MELKTQLIVFAAIVISVNNFVLFYAIKNNGKHSKIHSVGMLVFLISLIEIVAIGIWSYIHLSK